jgi:cellulose 1,4-beta-cellobiosidase
MKHVSISAVFVGCFLLFQAYAAITATNPFLGADLYVNPDYQKEVQRSIALHPDMTAQLTKAANIPAAYWIDRIARIDNITVPLDGARAQKAKTGKPTLLTFIIYDLPDRDCAALASNGEITCEDSNCAAGLAMYQTKYIDPIVTIFKKYSDLTIVAIIEPDSLPNLATNMNLQKCAQAQNAYMHGAAYAIKQLATIPNVAIYIDAAHGGWLGWENNRVKAASIFADVLNLAGGQNLIRGFATNTANYQPLGDLNDLTDPCKLRTQYNNASNEVIYVNLLSKTLIAAGLTNKYFIIDTSRNGVTNERKDCSNWCNIAGAGLGKRPTSDTSFSGISVLDAVHWLKTPGESDGTSDSSAPRYDAHCSSQDSFVPAPQAGQWFDAYFVQLVKNAVPAL